MENCTGTPDLAHMAMTMDFEFVLPVNAALHDLNEGIDLVLGEGGLKCDLREFEFGTALERFPWPFYGFSLGRLNFALTNLIFFERNDFRGPFGVGVILDLNIASRGLAPRFVGIAGMLRYVNRTEIGEQLASRKTPGYYNNRIYIPAMICSSLEGTLSSSESGSIIRKQSEML